MHKKERTFRHVTTRERWVVSWLLMSGLWLALGVGSAIGAPAGEDMAAKLGCPTCKLLGSETVVLPYTGVAYQRVKLLDEKTGLPRSVCLVEGGFLADEESLLAAEREVRWKAIGAMDPTLAELVVSMNENALLPVFIWGKVALPDVDPDWLGESDLNREVWALTVEEACAKSRGVLIEILESHGIKVDYEVEGAPMVHGLAKASDLWAVAKSDAIASIDLDTGPGVPTSTTWVYSVEAGLPHVWGIDGTGERIALQLAEKPPAADYSTKVVIQATANPNGTVSTRSTWAMGAIRSRPGVIPGVPDLDQGIAPASLDYMANWDGYQGLVEMWAYNQGAKVLVYAVGSSFADQPTATNHDKYVDYYARTYRVLVVASAGNRDVPGRPCSSTYSYVQNKFLNGLVVGGTNDQDTRSRMDDTIYACSSYTNPSFPWWPTEVPHVVAPAKGGMEGLDAGGYRYEGTSASASIVGGIASLVQDRNNAFYSRPEGVRAVVMATAWENVDGGRLNLTDKVDDKDGVGEVSAARAVLLADPSNKKDGGQAASARGFDYGTMSFPGDFSRNWYNETYNVSLPPYSALQAVLAWSATSTCRNYQQGGDCGTVTPDNDLDLYLYEGGTVQATSVSSHNAYEYIYYYNPTGTTKNLTLKVYWVSGVASSAYFGIAWDTQSPTNCPDTELCGPAEDYSENEVFRVSNDNFGIVQVMTTRLGTGEWVAIWATTDGCERYKERILYRFLDFDGNAVGEPQEAAGCRNLPDHPSIDAAPLGNDRFVMVWDEETALDQRRIHAWVYLGDGEDSGVFQVSQQSQNQLQPGVTSAGGEFWVVWRDNLNSRIVGRRCTGAYPGSSISCGSEVVLSYYSAGIGRDMDVVRAATLSNGRFVVVWGRKPQGNQTQLVGRVFDWNGTPFSSEFTISDLYDGGASSPMVFPDVSAIGTNLVVSWRWEGIKAKVMTQNGSAVCTVQDANSGTYGYLSDFWVPVVTASTVDVQFRVAWLVNTFGGAVFVPFWRRFSAIDCSPQGLETRIDESGEGSLLMNIFLSHCCSSTAIAVWSVDCEDPASQTCVRARVLAW